MIAFPSTSTNIPPLQLGAVSNIFWRVTMCGYERGASECMQFYMRRNAMWKTALCKNQSSPSIASAGANAFCTVLLYASTLTSHKVHTIACSTSLLVLHLPAMYVDYLSRRCWCDAYARYREYFSCIIRRFCSTAPYWITTEQCKLQTVEQVSRVSLQIQLRTQN